MADVESRRTGAGEGSPAAAPHWAGSREARMAARVLVAYGLLVLVAAVVGVRREAGLPTAPSWSVMHLVVVLALALGLLRGQRWAYPGTALLALVAFVLLLPVIAAVVVGPGLTLVVPRLDLLLIVLQAVALIVVLALLWKMRSAPTS